jgi:phage tail tube protein FII
MASVSLELNRGGNLFVEGSNLFKAFERASLPKPAENYESFTPGGGNGSIDIATHREPLELTFATKGWQPEQMKAFNTPFGERRKFTWLGALVDEYATDAATREKQVMCTCYGRLTLDMGEDKRDSLSATEYVVKSISKYVLVIGADEIYRFNIELGGWVMEGQSARIAQMIGITA